MLVNTANLQPFIGGQVEVQNSKAGYLHRSEILKAKVMLDTVTLTLAWSAVGEDFPPLPSKWTLNPSRTEFTINLAFYAASNIGPGNTGSDRLCLSSDLTGEIVVLYPPDGSKLQKPEAEV